MRAQLLIAVAALGLAQTAEASFFQKSCSSADGMVRVEDGQMSNHVTVTAWQRLDDRVAPTPVVLEHGDAKVEVLTRQELESEIHDGCKDGTGVSSMRVLTLEKVWIGRQDGQPFSEDYFGVGKDGAIAATLLCEQAANNRVFCGK